MKGGYDKEGDNDGGGRGGGAIPGGSSRTTTVDKLGKSIKSKNRVGGHKDVCGTAHNVSGMGLPSRRPLHAPRKGKG